VFIYTIIFIMCLIFIIQHQHPDFPLIILANRDEFYNRESVSAHFWPSHPQLLAGKDKQGGGTWLGLTTNGRFAAVTNFRQANTSKSENTRGHLVTQYLQKTISTQQYSQLLSDTADNYAGFNCLYGSIGINPELVCFSNQTGEAININDGIHGLSNALLNTHWPKVSEGKEAIEVLLKAPWNIESWLDFLHNTDVANDEQLPNTGIGIYKERLLSSRFIRTENYGTRCSTVITVAKDNTINFTERNFFNGQTLDTRHFTFKVEQ
jgi:uncharacterized protein with NRDE domain